MNKFTEQQIKDMIYRVSYCQFVHDIPFREWLLADCLSRRHAQQENLNIDKIMSNVSSLIYNLALGRLEWESLRKEPPPLPDPPHAEQFGRSDSEPKPVPRKGI